MLIHHIRGISFLCSCVFLSAQQVTVSVNSPAGNEERIYFKSDRDVDLSVVPTTPNRTISTTCYRTYHLDNAKLGPYRECTITHSSSYECENPPKNRDPVCNEDDFVWEGDIALVPQDASDFGPAAGTEWFEIEVLHHDSSFSYEDRRLRLIHWNRNDLECCKGYSCSSVQDGEVCYLTVGGSLYSLTAKSSAYSTVQSLSFLSSFLFLMASIVIV